MLLIGLAPDSVDPSDPDLPPGLTPETIEAGIADAMEDIPGRGWEAGFCSIRHRCERRGHDRGIVAEPWDCIVIGGGIRVPAKGLLLFERVVNAVGRFAPGTPIAFNTRPENSGEAAARWLGTRARHFASKWKPPPSSC